MGESPTLGKFGGKFWKEGGNDGRGKNGRERGKEEREQRGKEKRENGEGKEGKIVEENLKLKGERERYENEQQRTFFFHFLKQLKFVWGVPKWKFWGEIF